MPRKYYRPTATKFARVLEGEEHPHHILTEEDVKEMRELRRETKLPYFHIGDEYGVSPSVARKAINGENWRCVMDVPPVREGESDIPIRPTYYPSIEEIEGVEFE